MVETTLREMVTERVKREKEALLSAPAQIDVERLKFLIEVYQQTGMEPHIMRRAKLFHKLCSEKTIYIDDNPLAGTLTRYKYGAYPFPEEGCGWMKKATEIHLQRAKAPVTPEVREWIDKAVDYWKDINAFSQVRQTVLQSPLKADIRTLSRCGVALELTPGGTNHMILPDYSKVLTRGLRAIVTEIEEEETKLDIGSPGGLDKWRFYQATKLALSGMIVLAQRYASLAREMAQGERNAERKAELEDIASVCERVPANPARNFREAVQSFWFTMVGEWIEEPIALHSPPTTFTRCVYPFYKKDKEENGLTDAQAIELIQFFFLKMNQLACALPPHGFTWQQSRLGLQLSLGGLTPDGEDATNELDWLILEAQRQLMVPEPLVNLVYHDKLSEEFLLKSVDLIKTGIGQPAFHNSRVAIERHLYNHKMSLEEARIFGIVGCVQSSIPGCTDGYWYARFNAAKMVEFVLENGKDPLTGVQLGVPTGDAESFQTYDEFYQAFVKQLEYFVPLLHSISRIAWSVTKSFPTPFGSALVNDCIKKGLDLVDGGARYSIGDGICFVGVIDAANSLAAIKKLLFEEKRITLRQLKDALAADFEGYEEVERMCLTAPKYGNDDDYADSIARSVYQTCYDVHPKTDHLGRPVMPSAYSVTAHWAFGQLTGALPNGRKAKTPLADASVSSQGGTDKNGPTALVRSAARVLDAAKYGTSHFNMRFHPSALKGREGARKLLSMVKTYFDLGGYHVQFNCVSGETLKDAQQHPEKYRELIVRVAGFSAYFITLEKGMQDEIIKRTELSF